MTRSDLEHLLRAAADIANDDTIVVTGSPNQVGLDETGHGAPLPRRGMKALRGFL